jgi:uncharacterized 2Fe-2S/4Fe-4S cluster protein (DUF4445 family)
LALPPRPRPAARCWRPRSRPASRSSTCAKCKVIVSHGVSPLTEVELRHLSPDQRAAGYRLACQALIENDVEVVVPEESRRSRVSILVDSVTMGQVTDPWVRRVRLNVPEATLADQTPDWDNLAGALRAQTGLEARPTLRALRELPAALRAAAGDVTVVLADDRVIRVSPDGGPERLLGMAFDIGTTTVVGYLMDLETGEQLAVSSMLNPQTRYGDDVVSRIDFSAREPDGLATLQNEIIGAINSIIASNAASAGVASEDVLALAVVGNTTMQHLLLGVSPAALAQAPYVPAMTLGLAVRADELGIRICPDGVVYALPNIAGWVGADTVGVLLATGIANKDELALAIDIGTNGEMVMGSSSRLITCSTAAGPAFEGAHLSCGMRAADGAIDVVEIDSEVHWHTIGESAPRGLCGSGLVDVVAGMLNVGLLDNTGMLRSADTMRENGHRSLADLIQQEGRRRAFRLVSSEEGAGGRPVVITQRDLRELQLAKGAIRAGIEILMKELGIRAEDVRRVYLAGAFGNYIRPQSALAIGLIPPFPNAELVPVGNAAGAGAKMALLSKGTRDEATRMLARVEYLELSGRPDFQDEFSEAMVF